MRASHSQFVVLLVLAACGLWFSSAASAAMQPLDESWQYRWGDSPVLADGTPAWLFEDAPDQWHDIGFPSNPPGRDGRDYAWFRVTLPEGNWFHPVLYVYSVDIIVQVWFRGERLYQYGTFEGEGRGAFEGWPWHEIQLPDDYEGETLYFRVFSDYTDIGLWGEVAITEPPDLTLYILSQSAEDLIVSALSALIAGLALVFACIQRGQKSLATVALFSSLVAVMLLAESQASLLLLYRPLFWDYLAAASYYLIPVALTLLLAQWLGKQRSGLIRGLMWFHLVYAVGAVVGALGGLVALSSTFPVFDAVLVVSLLLIAMVAVRQFSGLYREQQILLLACGGFVALLILDMAVAHGFLPWGRVPVSWGALGFSLAVIGISVWHFGRTQRALHQLTARLEQKVRERTARAEALAAREVARGRLLALESKKSQKFADVIAALQDCAGIEEAFEGLLRAMPELYLPIAGGFYRRGQNGRYECQTQWGEARAGAFPLALGQGLSGITETVLPVRSDELPLQLYFFLRVESGHSGPEPEGVLALERPELPDELKDYGSLRVIGWVHQSVEKIGITLSGLALRAELQKFSYEDSLTGLKNRRHFDELFRHEREVSVRSERSLSLLIFDIDHFKRFNDCHGHEAGDQALRRVGKLLGACFRGSDTVCRYGGEEFAVLMPGASLEEARYRAEQLRGAIAAERIEHRGEHLGYLTISAGIACWPENCPAFEGLFRAADMALYEAKEAGRNRVVAATP
ncbi:GGDEF domain-containing protein [Marinobacter daepoensis]|uniref:GGDEF domain-containing protein n=1 Tax=Marinobacter daepoensis TaxID=262077 RepID=UPI001D17CD7D|nr:GGDEF domain-containing protein [Marinobacter daepoensis]